MKRVNWNDLFIEEDPYTSYDLTGIFYEDENLQIPYNGIVFDYNWEFEVKNGFMNGIEKCYSDETGALERESERKRNFIDGLERCFYQNGNLHFISIAIRNVYIYSVEYDENGNIKQKHYKELNSRLYDDIIDKVDLYMEKYKHIKELDLE